MNESDTAPKKHIALFQKHEIRRTIHDNEWFFVIADVVAVLTDSVNPQGYIKDMRRRDPELAKGWGQIATPFPSKPQAASRSSTAPTPRGFSVSFSSSHQQWSLKCPKKSDG